MGHLWWVIISNSKDVVWFRDPHSLEAFSETERLIGGNRALGGGGGQKGIGFLGGSSQVSLFSHRSLLKASEGPSEAGEAHMRIQTWLRWSGCQRKPKGPNFQDMASKYFSTCGFCRDFLLLLKGWVSKVSSFFYIIFLSYFEQGSNFPAVFA